MANKKRRLFHSRWPYFIIAGVIAIGFIAVRSRQGSSDKPIIRTAEVERGTITSTVSANGILQPLTTVEVKSNVGGQVVNLAVDEGDTVKSGQLIARIDPTDSVTTLEQSQADMAAALSKVNQARLQLTMQHQQNTAQINSAREALDAAHAKLIQAQEQSKIQPELTNTSIKQAESNLSAAEASLRQTKSALIPQKLASAQASYDQAKVSCDTVEKDLTRQKGLLAKGFVSKSVVESAEDKYGAAKAQLDTAKSKLQTVKDETDQDIFVAQAKVDQAQAALGNATANRVQDRLKKQEVTSANAALRQAQAALEVTLAAARQDDIKEGDIVQANAQVKRSEATLKNATTQVSYTTVTAPRAGIVTKKYVEAGSIVTAGRSSFSGTGSGVALVDIADVSRMFALVNVDETDIAQVEVGQEVDITVEAYPDELFTGKVTKIAPQSVTDQNVTTIPVTVEVEMPDKRLKPGMNVTCDFVTDRKTDVLTVPNEAVKESDNGSTVTVMDGDKQVVRKVETGLVGGEATEIKSGLKEGEKIVTAVILPTSAGQSSGGGGARAGGFGAPGGPGGMGGMGGGGGSRRGM